MKNAVVLGGSMGGLLAARVLSDHFEHVTIVERDLLPDEKAPRKGVPQGRQVHGLLVTGLRRLETFFPGIREELAESGAVYGTFRDQRWILGGHALATTEGGESGVSCSRPHLERLVRARVRKIANIAFLTEHDVLGIRHADGRIDGAHVRRRADGKEETLDAELVIDATGRGSKLPEWLAELGYPAPPEDRMKLDLTYTTAVFTRKPNTPVALVSGTTPPNRRFGIALALDEKRYSVGIGGYFGERAETTRASMLAMADGLPTRDLYDMLRDAELLEEPALMPMPFAQRRRYEALARHPEGLVAFADAICSFNPVYGQGMSVAAIEAEYLAKQLGAGTQGLPKRFYRAAKPLVDVAWSMATGLDLKFTEIEGKRPFGTAFVNGYIDRVLRRGANDPEVGTAFLRVVHMMDPPSALFAPKIALRAMLG